MKLISADDFTNQLLFRQISENNLIEMGVYRVMFGWRVRAGFCGNFFCELDWCAGGNWKDVERLYSLCQAILLKREENDACFEGLPMFSNKKPFFNDLEFLEIVAKEAGEFTLISLDKSYAQCFT
jgi:hypothetical protein